MNLSVLRQKRADAVKAMKDLNAKAEKEDRDLTAEEETQYAELNKEQASLKSRITRLEKGEELEGDAVATAPRRIVTAVREMADEDPSGGFKGHKDFFTAVMNAGMGRQLDSRLARFQATQGSDEQGTYSDPYGGFLVPTTVAPGVLSVAAEDDPLAGLVTSVPMATTSVKFNARVDKNHSTSVSGGLTVARRPETVDGSTSRMAFEPIQMTVHELFGAAFATESILTDSPGSFIALLQAGFRDEFSNKLISERINGSGTGEFQGILGAACTISVAKETGQGAATILTENIDKMVARQWRASRAVWLANHNTRPQLRALVRVVGTGGAPVPYFTQEGGRELLDGKPIFFTEHCKTIGTVGDLILADWSQYLEGTYQGLQQAESIHVRFLANERCFKFWLRNDGQPWWKSALTPKNGDTLSPFVTLATRA